MKLRRYENNPIIAPDPKHDWESLVTTNPGACYDSATGMITMLYRAAGCDVEHVVRLAIATSTDGYHFQRFDEPVVSPSSDGFDAGCIEDPRIVKFGDCFMITYATRPFPPGKYWLSARSRYRPPTVSESFPHALRSNSTSSGLLITRDFRSFIRAGRLTDPTLDDRDVILFPERIGGKLFMLHRPMEWVGNGFGTTYPAIWIAQGDDLLKLGHSQLLVSAKHDWETKIGGNTPPIRTDEGWLTLFHAVGPDAKYRIGALLLDLNDPTRVLHRTPHWILQPELEYEFEGPYRGCVFPCGKVVIDGTLFVYYGAADKYVALATCPLAALIDHLLTCPA